MSLEADQPQRRERDAARTREAILDAAEQLFAEHGYDAASLEAIGQLAGVSRGTPRYFFGAKESLYRAVLERVLIAESEFLLEAHARMTVAGGGPDDVLAGLVEGFIDFLAAHPSFVRLVEREATSGGGALREVAAETSVVQGAMATLAQAFSDPSFRQVDPRQLLLSLLALCWFPLAHAPTFTRGLGLDPDAPEFLSQWKRHVVALVLDGMRAS